MRHVARLLFLLAAGLTACETLLDEDLPFEGKRLVVFGVLSPETDVRIRVSQTYPPTGQYTFEGVEDAVVRFFENGVLVDTLTYSGGGIYVLPQSFRVVQGKAYHVAVSAPGFPDAETIPEITPARVPIEAYSFSERITDPLNDDEAYRLAFEFQDEHGTKNYYIATIEAFHRDSVLSVSVFDPARSLGVWTDDICGYLNSNILGIDDECFDGQTVQRSLGVAVAGFLQYDISDRNIWREADEMYLRFMNVSEDYYVYIARLWTDPEGFYKAFIDPKSPVSNVKGGYGLLTIANENVVRLK